MNTVELISQLQHMEVRLYLQRDKLCIDAPKGALSPDILTTLKQRKAEIVAFLRGIEPEEGSIPVTPRAVSEQLPLSHAQERLWFLYRLDPNSPQYNMPMALVLKGHLHFLAFEQGLDAILTRHEGLRTVFSERGGRPFQTVALPKHTNLPVIDLVSQPQRESIAKALAQKEAAEPFNLAKGPPLRAYLFKMSPTRTVFMGNMHHIVSDGWSLGIFLKELTVLYAAITAKRPPAIPPPPLQYADFAVWQRGWLKDHVLKTQKEYWLAQLSGAPKILNLPRDRPRPKYPGFRGASLVRRLSKSHHPSQKQVARHTGVTRFMLLLAVYRVLLQRYSGQDDILVGTPVANRNRAELENVIGFFVNTLVLRTRFHEKITFREVLSQVKDTTLAAYHHQDIPFEKLVGELRPERNAAVPPIFQVMLTYQNLPDVQASPPGIQLRPWPLIDDMAKFDITLTVVEEPTALAFTWNFSTALFDRTTIHRMARHFRELWVAFLDNPDLGVNRAPLMTPGERFHILSEWNATQTPVPDDFQMVRRFEHQVARGPDAVAVVMDEDPTVSLSFEELGRRAQYLAGRLRDRGIGPESVVGIYGERGLDWVVAVLAVLRTGGVYLPLEPSLPIEWRDFMIRDSRARLVLLLRPVSEWEPPAPFLRLDHGAFFPIRKNPDLTASNAAYLIYTSGSTGQPKASVMSHSALANQMHWLCKTFRFGPRDRLLQKTALGFDASIWEIFAPLITGGALVLSRPRNYQDPTYLLQAVLRHRISLLQVVPTLLRMLLAASFVPGKSHLRWLFSGGETLSTDLVVWTADSPVPGLVNLYGPTETCINSTCLIYKSGDVLSLGRPLANMSAFVLDSDLQPIPIGVTGEIHLRGMGLSRGYLGRPGLTAETFIPDPFNVPRGLQTRGGRLYRSGDLARFRPDGTLDFLGRANTQVKLRGNRLELGEIETVLRDHPAVKEAVTLIWQPKQGDDRLVAYVQWKPERESRINDQRLQAYLGRKLPNYMVPSLFQTVESFPLLASGKIDRRALHTPVRPAADKPDPTFPASIEEGLICEIFAAVLSLEWVGPRQDFFELGGHSLLATQVISRIRDAFGVELPVRTVFEKPTALALAPAIRKQRHAELEPATPVEPVATYQTYWPASFAQQRLWFLDRLEPGSAVYHLPAALRLKGGLAGPFMEAAFLSLFDRHHALRTQFGERDGRPYQEVMPQVIWRMPLVDFRDLPRSHVPALVSHLAAEGAARPFDLEKGPLFRAILIRLQRQEHVLIMTMHHIVSDGWSMGILIREMITCYKRCLGFTVSPPPPLPLQYPQYAAWQREWLRGDELNRQMDFWTKRLQDKVPALELPRDRPRAVKSFHRGANHLFHLGSNLFGCLTDISREAGVTRFMAMLTVFQVLLWRYSGQRDILVGTPVANRNRTELESLIGFFVNTLVIRTVFRGEPTFREVLAGIRRETLDVFSHQDIPFEKLVEVLQPERDLSRSPIFQVMFVYQNTPMPHEAPPGLQLETLSSDFVTAKFDLTLTVVERGSSLDLSLNYDVDLFHATTIQRMAVHFLGLLEALVATPERAVTLAPFLTGAEKNQILSEWNATPTSSSNQGMVQDQVEKQAIRTPEATALIMDGDGPNAVASHLTFGVLIQKTDDLAGRLQARGVMAERVVGIYSNRSLDLVIAQLAVLRAGGAYLPLVPDLPATRLHFMSSDADVSLVLYTPGLGSWHPSREYLLLEPGPPGTRPLGSKPQFRGSHGSVWRHRAAYVLYTSGSTGQPKGTINTHGALANHMSWFIETFALGPGDRLLQKTPMGFDASVWEFYAALMVGGALVLAPTQAHRNPANLIGSIMAQRITLMQVVPTLLRLLVEQPEFRVKNPLRLLFCGGEPLTSGLGDRTARVLKGELINLYGLTEACIDSTFEAYRPGDPAISIGRPVSQVQALVMDTQLQPLPIGAVGELYIGGLGLGRGYLGRYRLTAAAFLPGPFSKSPGSRIYRSGDLARFLPDGRLLLLGRINTQIKIRGLRVELGEIEAQLRAHASVREAQVLVWQLREDDKRLAAYVRWEPGQAQENESLPAATVLRHYLSQHLPGYMIPAAFVMVENFPLTPSGKIDRRALPPPNWDEGAESRIGEKPRNLEEELLTLIFAQVLGRKQVGRDQSFFELGGHSLLAIQVSSRVKTVLGLELPVRWVFEHPTPAALAKVIASERTHHKTPSPPLQRLPTRDNLPLSFAQQRLWLLYRLNPEDLAYNLSHAIRSEGPLCVANLEKSLNATIDRHETLRTNFEVGNGVPVQVIHPHRPLTIPLIDLSGLSREFRERRVHVLGAKAGRFPFDLARDSLVRCRLLRLDPNACVLLLDIHHIVSDGWSNEIFVKETRAAYESFTAAKPLILPPLPIQYADYAHWQRTWLQGEVLAGQMAYWKKTLAGISPLQLPVDHNRPQLMSTVGKNLPFRIPGKWSKALTIFCRRLGVTPFMVLMAAFQWCMNRLSGQDDVVVGTPVANRTKPETQGLIGFFVNTLLLRIQFPAVGTRRGLVQTVRENLLQALAHQDLPFEKIVEELRPERVLNRNPLFQVMFVYQAASTLISKKGPLTWTPLDYEKGSTHFDITLSIEEPPSHVLTQSLIGNIEYHRDLFNPSTIRRLAHQYVHLLSAILCEPDFPLADFLPEATRHQLLREWNQTEAGRSFQPIPQRVWLHCQNTPDSVALVFQNQGKTACLTYWKFGERVNLLADHLQRRGLRPEEGVAICLDRSLEMIIACLGVMAAGGAYIPIDPAFPRSRKKWIMASARAGFQIAGEHRADQDEPPPLVIDDPVTWEPSRLQRDVRTLDPRQLAYVIFTSGSTGRPKGVGIPHLGLSNMADFQRSHFGVQATDRVLQFASLSFDASVWEWVMALCSGAALVLAEKDLLLPGPDLLACLSGQFITRATLPPSALAVMPESSLSALNTLISAGEACPPGIVAKWAGARSFFNAYGPSENTVCASIQKCIPDGRSPSIGRPLDNQSIFIVDKRLYPVPLGAMGELLIGGIALARGYLARADLTSEKFIPDPMSSNVGARLYRSGDSVSQQPTGEIVFRGRLDRQVKLRGYRIELEEIEALLSKNPLVREALVLLDKDPPHDAKLVAYVVGSQASTQAFENQLYDDLKAHLPAYMIPSAILSLEAFPLTISGKIDRKALPSAKPSQTEGDDNFQSMNLIEEIVAGIFASVLGRRHFSSHQNFFEMGGHSLLATQVVSRIRDKMGVDLSVRTVFENPTVADLTQALLDQQRASANLAIPGPRPLKQRDRYPLSFAQQRLWFLEQLEPGRALYNISSATRLQGPLSCLALAHGLDRVIERHETLRTVFGVKIEQPFQRVHPYRALPFPLIDATALASEARKVLANQRVRVEAARPFNLEKGPLVRAYLIRLKEQDHLLLVTMHHIISDGWSMELFVREWMLFYKNRLGLAGRLPPQLPIQYRDFGVWQREWLRGEALARQLAFWRRRLGQAFAPLALPTDRPPRPDRTHRGANYLLKLEGAVLHGLRYLAKQEGVTSFMALLAVFQTLLHRYSSQRDILVGAPIANRTRAEMEPLIGFFVNTLVFRASFEERLTFRGLLDRIRGEALGAYSHQDIPFEKLVEEFQPERDLARSPLFQVMFVYRRGMKGSSQLQGVRMRPWPNEVEIAKFDLTLSAEEYPQHLVLGFNYDVDLFDLLTIRRMAGHLLCLVETLCAQPGLTVHRTGLLTPAERTQILFEWNGPRRGRPPQAAFERIWVAAERTPESVALVMDSSNPIQLSYRALAREALLLACHLRERGVCRETTVGVHLKSSPRLAIALLAIHKAGGAYLPLLPDHPIERLRLMVEDAKPEWILVQEETNPWQSLAQTLEFSTLPGNSRPFKIRTSPLQAAYVIYTSGSTGRPKGVVISHGALANHMFWLLNRFPFGPEDRLLQKTAIAFDASVWEFFAPLMVGATLVMAKPEGLRDPAYLVRSMKRQRITLLQVVPTILSMLLAESGFAENNSLRMLFCGGEELRPELASRMQWPGLSLVNFYGPTEACINTTFHRCMPGRKIPIGRPLANVYSLVLDRQLEPFPIGVRGELFIGGACLARGYLNQPDHSAECFLPNPFAGLDEIGGRLYRSGDAVRYGPDGALEFLGRTNTQIKLRGVRIELGEIEALLRRHPAVREACVQLWEKKGPQLVAYVQWKTSGTGLKIGPTQWRRFLANKLPEAVIPSRFETLASFPLTPSGKIDRRALPEPNWSEVVSTTRSFRVEEDLVADIFAGVLGLDRVGLSHNFFEMGGHSLMATQVVSRIRHRFRVDLPVRAVFENPTVTELTQAVVKQRKQMTGLSAPPLKPVARRDRYPLSFAQQRLWFIEQLNPGSGVYHIPIALRLTGPLCNRALEEGLFRVIQRHEALRTSFVVDQGKPYQRVAPELDRWISHIDVSGLPTARGRDVAFRLAAGEASRPFDLNQGPLLRAALVSMDRHDHLLLLTLHHIISDGWSMDLLIGEWVLFYKHLLGVHCTLPAPLTIQYPDFAQWQREWLRGEPLARQLAFWRERLGDDPPALALPTDLPRRPIQANRGAQFYFKAGPETLGSLDGICRREGVTRFMVILAVFQSLLHHLSGQDDILVGTPIANRNHAETEPLIGFFVNTLVLRARFGGCPSFLELLAGIRRETLDAYSHQDIPFEKLVEEFQPERDLTRSPFFQAMFAYRHPSKAQASLPGMDLQPGPAAMEPAKFELTLTAFEGTSDLRFGLNYDADLFHTTTIRRMANQFLLMLNAIYAEPARRVHTFSLLSPPQRQHVLWEWQGSDTTPLGLDSYANRFEGLAGRIPDRIVLVGKSHNGGWVHLSLGALNHKALAFAHKLGELGLGPERTLGLCLDRGPELIWSLLAAWKVGGAYVPLDPRSPAERTSAILRNAGIAVLVTHSHYEPLFSSFGGPRLDPNDAFASRKLGRLASPKEADHLAYLIYTSGSTGVPKGVAVAQGNLLPFHTAMKRAIFRRLPAPLQLGLNAPIFFDASVQILTALLEGHCLHIVPEDDRLDAGAFLRFLERFRVNLFDCTPSHLKVFLEEGLLARSHLAVLAVLVGGEAIASNLWQGLANHPKIRFFNVYGPTECTVNVTFCPITLPVKTPLLGRPLSHTRVYVVNRLLLPVPPGSPGELCLGGAQVSRGYFHDPAATAVHFVPNPWRGIPGTRIYRSGDKVRFQTNGELVFLGRMDFQIKIRGFRLEPGEIEACLERDPNVDRALVSAKEMRPGEPRLVAYITLVQPEADAPGRLVQAVGDKLPAYMVPEAWVLLDAFPMAPGGKIDRKALPIPTAKEDREDGLLEPGDNLEETLLAKIFARVLGRERVSHHRNFFEMGGHSLLATRVISGIRDHFEIEIPVRAIFENPTVVGLAQVLVKQRQDGRGLTIPPIVPVPPRDRYPLSFAQQRLWFLEQFEPGGAMYHIPRSLRLQGFLDAAALEGGLLRLTERHQALRTYFVSERGQAFQRVSPDLNGRFAIVDASRLHYETGAGSASRLANEEAARPFDLGKGPLLRAVLIRLSKTDHLLLVTMHHIISDGWSMELLVREWVNFYKNLLTQTSAWPDPLSIQYPDFAVWQRGWLRGEALERQMAYWRKRLAERLPPLELPNDRPHSPRRTHRGANHFFDLDRDQLALLTGLAGQEGVTRFMILLAVLQTLLYRYASQENILVGAPIANRNRAEIEPLIGFFVNTLVYRMTFDEQITFRELLARVRKETLGAYSHQDIPFEKLVEAFQPERDLARSPLFQVMFTYQRGAMSNAELPGIRIRPWSQAMEIAKFDLTLSAVDYPRKLNLGFNYDTDLFDAATIDRMARHFLVLFESLCGNPDAAVSRARYLSGAERVQILWEWNATQTIFPHERPVHEWIGAQAERYPDALALAMDLPYNQSAGNQISYGVLAKKALVLARQLRNLGVEPDTGVGVYARRSPELIVALLAVLSAGGVYLPLVPDQPTARLDLMVQEAQPRLILVQPGCPAWTPAFPTMTIPSRQAGDTLSKPSPVHPFHAAYCLYTSGSTGLPKGVVINHGALTNQIHWLKKRFAINPEDRLLQKTAMGFDASVWEFFAPLTAGASLVLAHPDGHHDPAYLAGCVRRMGITLLQVVPTLLRMLLEEPHFSGELPRFLFAGGEALHPEWAEQASRLPGTTLVNLYGPSETCINSTYQVCRPGEPVTIGRPVANGKALVLDRGLRLLPIGVRGELFIGGRGLARGYLAQPSLTAAVFLPDPFAQHGPGGRLYRSGDAVRLATDGEIAFLGRFNFQVKLRGNRIELGEIEVLLRGHPLLEEALVKVWQRGREDRVLVAYVQPKKGKPAAARLRRYLAENLPDYMVPSVFVFLESFPLTSHGKIDRQSLPEPAPGNPPKLGADSPRDSLELVLKALWEEVLDIRPIGLKDHFFLMGGHSLMAMKLMALARERLGRDLPLKDFFQQPTIEQMAASLQRAEPWQPPSPLVIFRESGKTSPFFCVHPIGGNVFCYGALVHHLGPDVPFIAVQAPALYGGPTFETLSSQAAYYLQAIQSLQQQGPFRLGGWSLGGVIAFEMARQLRARGERVACLTLIDSHLQSRHDEVAQTPSQLAALKAFLTDLGQLHQQDLDPVLNKLCERPHDERLNFLYDALLERELLPAAFKREDLGRLWTAFQNNHQMAGRYHPGSYDGTIFYVRAKGSRAESIAIWRRLAKRIVCWDGGADHHGLLREPAVDKLADALRPHLLKTPNNG